MAGLDLEPRLMAADFARAYPRMCYQLIRRVASKAPNHLFHPKFRGGLKFHRYGQRFL